MKSFLLYSILFLLFIGNNFIAYGRDVFSKNSQTYKGEKVEYAFYFDKTITTKVLNKFLLSVTNMSKGINSDSYIKLLDSLILKLNTASNIYKNDKKSLVKIQYLKNGINKIKKNVSKIQPSNTNTSSIATVTASVLGSNPVTNIYIPIENTGTSTGNGKQIITTVSSGCDTLDIVLTNGQVWAACNVGSNVAGLTARSYGSYYQWGATDTSFSIGGSTNVWGEGGQGPCNNGYHVPTKSDWTSASDLLGLTILNILKLPKSGHRNMFSNGAQSSEGPIVNTEEWGYYWSSSRQGDQANAFIFLGTKINPTNLYPIAFGNAVRCIKN